MGRVRIPEMSSFCTWSRPPDLEEAANIPGVADGSLETSRLGGFQGTPGMNSGTSGTSPMAVFRLSVWKFQLVSEKVESALVGKLSDGVGELLRDQLEPRRVVSGSPVTDSDRSGRGKFLAPPPVFPKNCLSRDCWGGSRMPPISGFMLPILPRSSDDGAVLEYISESLLSLGRAGKGWRDTGGRCPCSNCCWTKRAINSCWERGTPLLEVLAAPPTGGKLPCWAWACARSWG